MKYLRDDFIRKIHAFAMPAFLHGISCGSIELCADNSIILLDDKDIFPTRFPLFVVRNGSVDGGLVLLFELLGKLPAQSNATVSA